MVFFDMCVRRVFGVECSLCCGKDDAAHRSCNRKAATHIKITTQRAFKPYLAPGRLIGAQRRIASRRAPVVYL